MFWFADSAFLSLDWLPIGHSHPPMSNTKTLPPKYTKIYLILDDFQ
jgi:hypothetical protein